MSMGQTTDQGHSPEEERVSQKELVQACQPILSLSSFPVLFLRMLPACITCCQTFCLKLHLHSQKLLRICKEFHFMWAISIYI